MMFSSEGKPVQRTGPRLRRPEVALRREISEKMTEEVAQGGK
jgi:hypothetical protein